MIRVEDKYFIVELSLSWTISRDREFFSLLHFLNYISPTQKVIPAYSMGLFKIPKSICGNINSILSKYWWGQTKEERKIH